MSIYDTRGFEAGDSEAISNCEKAIVDLREMEREEDQLHVAWLCVEQSTGRFEAAHVEFVRFLRAHDVPTIVVITKMKSDPDTLEELIRKNVPATVTLINIMAQAMNTRAGVNQPEGLEQLLKATEQLIPDDRRAALAAPDPETLQVRAFLRAGHPVLAFLVAMRNR